jgi:hypothetical protein
LLLFPWKTCVGLYNKFCDSCDRGKVCAVDHTLEIIVRKKREYLEVPPTESTVYNRLRLLFIIIGKFVCGVHVMIVSNMSRMTETHPSEASSFVSSSSSAGSFLTGIWHFQKKLTLGEIHSGPSCIGTISDYIIALEFIRRMNVCHSIPESVGQIKAIFFEEVLFC